MKLLIVVDDKIPQEYINKINKKLLFFNEKKIVHRPEFEFVYVDKEEENKHAWKMKMERRKHYPNELINHVLLEPYDEGMGINQNNARKILVNYVQYTGNVGSYTVYIMEHPLLHDVYTFYENDEGEVRKQQHLLQTYGLFSIRSVLISIDNLSPEQFAKVYVHEWLQLFIKEHCDESSTITNYNCLMSRLAHPTDVDLANGLCENHTKQIVDYIDITETVF